MSLMCVNVNNYYIFFYTKHLPSFLSISFFEPESIANAEILPESHFCSSLYQFYENNEEKSNIL